MPFIFDAAGTCNRSLSPFADPGQTYQSLKDLGSRLQLSACRKVRPVVLAQDLVSPRSGAVEITPVDLGNTCDRVGGPRSNYKP